MERCKTCKHWEKPAQGEYGALRGSGECQKAPQIWEVTNDVDVENDPFMTVKELKPEHAGVLAMVNDGSQFSATLITMPDFGCVQHERL